MPFDPPSASLALGSVGHARVNGSVRLLASCPGRREVRIGEANAVLLIGGA